MKAPALTSLRFFAAFLVVAFHASETGYISAGWLAFCLPVQAVTAFFVLSGFVLQSAYGPDLRGLSAPVFLAHRVARVWPLHAAIVAILIIVVPSWAMTGDTVRTLTLTQAWSSDRAIYFWAMNVPSWSLSAELFFYAMFPIITATVRRHPALAAVGALTWIGAVIMLAHPADDAARVWDFYILPTTRFPEFIFGMIAAEMMPTLRRARMSAWAWTCVEAGALIGLVAVNVGIAVGLPGLIDHVGPNAAAWLKGSGGLPAAVAVIVVFALGRGAIARMLSSRALVWLGEASFALYLVHWPLLSIDWPGGVVGYAVVCVTVMTLMHLCIEKPALAASKAALTWLARTRQPLVA